MRGTADVAPMRPVTFVVDTRLSEGPVENFTDLAVDPYKLVAILKPSAPPSTPPLTCSVTPKRSLQHPQSCRARKATS